MTGLERAPIAKGEGLLPCLPLCSRQGSLCGRQTLKQLLLFGRTDVDLQQCVLNFVVQAAIGDVSGEQRVPNTRRVQPQQLQHEALKSNSNIQGVLQAVASTFKETT